MLPMGIGKRSGLEERSSADKGTVHGRIRRKETKDRRLIKAVNRC